MGITEAFPIRDDSRPLFRQIPTTDKWSVMQAVRTTDLVVQQTQERAAAHQTTDTMLATKATWRMCGDGWRHGRLSSARLKLLTLAVGRAPNSGLWLISPSLA